MDLIGRLRAWALASPRLLVVDAPGSRPLRWAVEAELDRRGWAQALSPSDADVLLVLGAPGPELAGAVELLWSQIPRPRLRMDLLSEADVQERLTAAPRELAAATEQADGAAGDDDPGEARTDQSARMDHSGHGDMAGMADPGHGGMDHSGDGDGDGDMAGMADSGHGGMDHSGDGDGDGDMAGMADSGHGGMDHSDMSGDGHSGHHMHHGGEVAGLPMAETAPDRDGLQLDVLRVSLGPVLPEWPTGLLLRAELQGDVVTGAQLSWLDAGDRADAAPGADPRRAALAHLASLLSVAGWPTAARDVRRVRDGLGSPDPGDRATAEQRGQRVLRRVRRSRTLAWSLQGIGRRAGREPGTDGDVLDRMLRWCAVATDGGAVPGPGVMPLDELASLLLGSEVAAARLLVASVELQRTVEPAQPETVGA